jgi:8-oxo-dGTP diphosphatase
MGDLRVMGGWTTLGQFEFFAMIKSNPPAFHDIAGPKAMALEPIKCRGCGQTVDVGALGGNPAPTACPFCGTRFEKRRKRQIRRRRGTAIVDTPNGILVVAGKRRMFMLPGGGAQGAESRRSAAIRELREETGLKAKTCRFLFSYNSPVDGRRFRNMHKVFLIEADGVPEPDTQEVKYLDYWNERSDFHLSDSARTIIDIYLNQFKRRPDSGFAQGGDRQQDRDQRQA